MQLFTQQPPFPGNGPVVLQKDWLGRQTKSHKSFAREFLNSSAPATASPSRVSSAPDGLDCFSERIFSYTRVITHQSRSQFLLAPSRLLKQSPDFSLSSAPSAATSSPRPRTSRSSSRSRKPASRRGSGGRQRSAHRRSRSDALNTRRAELRQALR